MNGKRHMDLSLKSSFLLDRVSLNGGSTVLQSYVLTVFGLLRNNVLWNQFLTICTNSKYINFKTKVFSHYIIKRTWRLLKNDFIKILYYHKPRPIWWLKLRIKRSSWLFELFESSEHETKEILAMRYIRSKLMTPH